VFNRVRHQARDGRRAGTAGGVQAQQALRVRIGVPSGLDFVEVPRLRNTSQHYGHGHQQRDALAETCGGKQADYGAHDGQGQWASVG